MSTGDPLFECPFCKGLHYSGQGACNCEAWNRATAQYFENLPAVDIDRTYDSEKLSDTKILMHENPSINTAREHNETLVVCLYGGPGCGKSTMASGLFFELKSRGVTSELALEYAKDLVWSGNHKILEDQIHVFGEQHYRIFRLLGQVRVIITDSPLLLTPIYDKEKRPTLEKLVAEEHSKLWNYNAFIVRKKKFNQAGRINNEQQAMDIDMAIVDLLDRHNQSYETFEGTPAGKDKLVGKVLKIINYEKI
jgi:hypothetical protein